MSEYPTEEEQFEMMYEEELEMLSSIDDENINPITNTAPRPGTSKSFFQQSPAPSQISFDASQAVNRRLFGTPHPNHAGRVASTPMPLSPSIPSTSQNAPLNEMQLIGRKRRLEDLFGDIQDIEEDDRHDYMFEGIAKKIKSEEEIDLEMIDKILDARKLIRAQLNPLKKTNLDKLEALHKFKMQNLSYSLPRWPFTTLIRSDKERLYVRMHSEEYEDKQIKDINFAQSFGMLLGEAKEEIWSRAQKIIEFRLNNAMKPPAVENSISEVTNLSESNLWVEKYRPKKYLDLLSDETTNRSILSWLKMWDKIVFNKEFKVDSIKMGPPNTFNKRTGKFENFGNFRRKGRITLKTDVDNRGRPIQKVALLCGPPGLGKTTLAHTIAKHAGYVVREINASDDRSPEAFKLALENGTQMKSVLNQEQRPNCIILDEIDGAPLPSIEYLIRFINDNITIKSHKKGIVKNMILKRPIICICNDMYVPSLRQLRQIAFVVNFPPMESARLAERLLVIAKRERLKTDMTSLLALAEKTGNDVRSCLSMLQFFNSIKQPLTLIDVLKSNIGQKDRQKGLFGVWGSIFQIQRPRKTLIESNINNDTTQMVSMTDTSAKSRMANILDVVHRGGDYERLMTGVYENYLAQKMPDPDMVGVAEATDWFCFSDRIQNIINQQQNYAIYPYLQFSFVVWHFLFASMAWPKINFPNQGFEFSQKTKLQKMIYGALRKGFCATSRGVGEGPAIILDTIPLLKKVLCPTLRSVSLQLLTPRERADLRHAVEVMADLGLAYTQTKSIDGNYLYQMEPDIDVLCHFNDTQSHPMSYWSRQIIAREVELEVMRRAAPKSKDQTKTVSAVIEKSKPTSQQNGTTPNHLRTLQPKFIRTSNFKETTTKDFFGRISTKTTTITVQEGGTDVIVKSPIWYRYKEGFNNAVRKDVTIMDLL